MATVTCYFVVPGGAKGGQLQGRGFGGAGITPVLNNGDSLTVSVQWGGPTVPSALTGYFVFSSAQDSDPSQTAPSPFLNGSNYECFDSQPGQQTTSNGTTTFTFSKQYTYGGGLPGNYELTFIAEINSGTANVTQWSADPEFDTSN
jgi:hypothetical protein